MVMVVVVLLLQLRGLQIVIKLLVMMAIGTAPTGTAVMVVMIVMQILRIFHNGFGRFCKNFVPYQRFGMQH